MSVDGFETIEFADKANLTLNGNAGDDVINAELWHRAIAADKHHRPLATVRRPATRSVVNGTAAADAIVVDSLTSDGAVVTGAQPVPVTVTTTEQLVINGQGGNDSLQVDGDGRFVHTPGDLVDRCR